MAQIRDISKRTALYERLSKDDEQQGESNSILNQKQYLEEYAHKNGFVNIQHFTDDGYTGRNFNRPGFQEMLAEIENGKIGTVIVKDMSRFGRNYLQVGFYTEMMFPQKQVRFIAINNSVDSDKPQDNDFTPFLNIMNEWYAKDTSNKIKSIFLSRMNDGKRCSGSIPYGYNRLPGDKQTLVVDPVASKVVKHIFALAADGYNPPTIAKKLTEEEVLIPSAYTLQYHPEQCNRKSEWGCTRWNPTTVREILERQEYLGHTVLRKTIGTNFKTDARRSSTDEEKLIFKDTHEPIIEEPVWTRVQKELKCHKYSPDRGKYQLTCRLPGLVYCADCGRVMGYNIRHNVNSDCYFYRCSTYSGYQTTQHRACTAHIISDDVLCELVLHSIQRMAKHIIADEKALAAYTRASTSGAGIQSEDYIDQYYAQDNQKKALELSMKTDMGEHMFPPTSVSEENQDRYSEIMSQVKTLADEMEASFICGTTPMSEWDSYQQKLKDAGIEEAVQMMQEAYDTYMAN